MTLAPLAAHADGPAPTPGTIAVLGMSYRPDTYIVEESAGLHIAQTLKRHGCRVLVHDYASDTKNARMSGSTEFRGPERDALSSPATRS